MSAVLIPLDDDGNLDWAGFEAHVARTVSAGLTPAVNMDTGYVQLLSPAERSTALTLAGAITDDFVAGCYVDDEAGSGFDLSAYMSSATDIAAQGGRPVIFPSHGLCGHGDDAWIEGHRRLAPELDSFIAFELGQMFVAHGRVVSLDTYAQLLEISECVGAKHSSLDRSLEWRRIELRDRVRPDFSVFTGNDLAIDMVIYGSDYLLGLSTFAPDLFAERDRCWAEGGERFWALNDLLQYLGQFAFRPRVPGYRHDAAMFLELRGWASSSRVPDGAPTRPEADRDVLRDIAERLGVLP